MLFRSRQLKETAVNADEIASEEGTLNILGSDAQDNAEDKVFQDNENDIGIEGNENVEHEDDSQDYKF